MFSKRVDPSDFRVHTRHGGSSMRVLIDGEECTLLDYSDGGVRITSRAATRRVALIEIYKGSKCIRKSPAIVAWRRDTQAGYAFRSNLKVCEVEGAQQYRRQPEQEVDRSKNSSGAVSGDALRRRLKM